MEEKIKIFELFAGYGGASFGLKKAGIDFECVGFSEIDKHAIKIYKQNHGDIKNFGDITKINPKELPDFDLLTGGFPCQSFSVAGKGLGTCDKRGVLFFDIIRILKEKRPKYILLENVKGLTLDIHKEFFRQTKIELLKLGYKIDVRIYNTKDYGIPQNRERVFYVGMLDELFYTPPKKKPLLKINEILENNIDDKYYLSNEKIEKIKKDLNKKNIKLELSNSIIEKHTFPSRINQIFNFKYTPTLTASKAGVPLLVNNNIRYLTPKECFRLMGFLNDEINLSNISDNQLYKLAGNGWDINLVSLIFKQIFLNKKNNRIEKFF